MGHKVIEYVDASQIYATNYIRNSKAIAVLWAIFTICYSIIVVVSFVTPGKIYESLLLLLNSNTHLVGSLVYSIFFKLSENLV
jgi:hypothetical protein